MNHRLAAAALAVVLLAAFGPALAQTPGGTPETGSSDPAAPAAPAAGRAGAPSLDAKLVDAQAKAQKKSATVVVKVRGVRLVDPGAVMEKPKKGQGHLHYRVDGGPVIATTATKLSFHELASGPHKIEVSLAANDHSPLGPSATLEVTVP